jgi:hypothetical protein
MKHRLRLMLATVTMAAAALAHAGPMGFKDSTMAMGDFSPNWREAWVNHALTPRDALGAGGLYMRSDDKKLTREFAELTYTRLLHRINGEHSQANIWFVGGAGSLRGNDFGGSKTMLAPGVSADYETTRFYASARSGCTARRASSMTLPRCAPAFRSTRSTTTKPSRG